MEFRAKKTSVKAKDNLPPPKIFRAADFLWNAPALLRVYGRVNYTFDCKFVSKSLFNWGILHIPYSFRKSFEKRAQFASVSALQNNLHMERNRLREASIEERIGGVWFFRNERDSPMGIFTGRSDPPHPPGLTNVSAIPYLYQPACRKVWLCDTMFWL